MALQIVYVLTNPAMPGVIRIGKTLIEDVSQRLSQLYTTGVPFPFELTFACKVPNADEVERALHRAFAPNRINPRREFFKIEPEQAIAILKLLHVEDATAEVASLPTAVPEEDLDAGKQYRSRRPNFNFREMGIPVGATLEFSDSAAQVTVAGDRKVLLGDEELSLTAATRRLLALEYSVAPGPFWTYQGKRLGELYEETYGQAD